MDNPSDSGCGVLTYKMFVGDSSIFSTSVMYSDAVELL
jgi:hypothetical protein